MSLRKPKGYWQKWENLESAVKVIIAEHGRLPPANELVALGYVDVSTAITRYHGGFNYVRLRLDELGILKVGKKDSLRHWDILKIELEKIVEQEGRLPGSSKLISLGYGDISSAIEINHGGYRAVRERLKKEDFFRARQSEKRENSKPHGYWSHWKNLKRELRPILKEHGDLPSARKLIMLGYKDIVSAIDKYHGGFPKVRQRLEESGSNVECCRLEALVRRYIEEGTEQS